MRTISRVVLASACAWLGCLVAPALVAQQAPADARPSVAGSAAPTTGPADGASIYAARCANCHGTTGKGDGVAAGLLVVKPRDFTTAQYKIRSTESGELPTDEDLARSIKTGLHGSSMPDWQAFLGDAQIQALVGHIKTFSPRFASGRPQPVKAGAPVAPSPGSVASGRAVYERLKCGACHGPNGDGDGAMTSDLKDSSGRALTATRLTEPWTFRGGAGVTDVYMRFRTGMNGTPMPSFKDAAGDTDLWHLANYVLSMGRKPVWELTSADVPTFYADLDSRERRDPAARGRYLLNTLGCAFCHSPVTDAGGIVEPFAFAGGQRVSLYPFPSFVTYNLTSDKETGLGGWTDTQIKNVLTRGIRPDGSRMYPFPMPWPSYGNLTPADVEALVAGLRSLPPVSNTIPPPVSPNIVSMLWGKFQMLILHRDLPAPVYAGNAGTPKGGRSWQTGAR